MTGSSGSRCGPRRHWLCGGSVAVFGLLVVAAWAQAQVQATSNTPGVKVEVVKPGQPAQPAGGAECGSKAPAGQEPVVKTEGPQPKWVCDAETVTLEPVWQGKPIEPKFVIRNEGLANLDIKLKGG